MANLIGNKNLKDAMDILRLSQKKEERNFALNVLLDECKKLEEQRKNLLNEILICYQNAIKSQIRNHFRGRQNLSEIVAEVRQEVFINMSKSIHKVKKRSSFSPWLSRLVHHACIDYQEKEFKKKVLSLSEAQNEEFEGRFKDPEDKKVILHRFYR